MSSGIEGRTVGKFPISIASSLGLEGGLGIYPDTPIVKAPLLEYDQLWINLRTIFRNIMGALDKDVAASIMSPTIVGTMLEEMEMMENVIREYTNNKVKVVFYYSNYKNLDVHFKLGVPRVDNTEKQKEYTAIHNQTIRLLFENQKSNPSHDIRVFDLALRLKEPVKAMIITHYPIDLLSSKEFSKLVLLESHTGKILDKASWYLKYYEGKTLAQIPFNDVFIRVFGDNSSFRPMAIGIRKEILEIASKYHWSSVSTHDKLLYGIGQMKNHYSRDILRSMF